MRFALILLLALVALAVAWIWLAAPWEPEPRAPQVKPTEVATAAAALDLGGSPASRHREDVAGKDGLEKPAPAGALAGLDWMEDADTVARVQETIRGLAELYRASWAKVDPERVERTLEEALAKNCEGSKLLASLRMADFQGLAPLQLEAVADFVNEAKRNLREFGPDPFGKASSLQGTRQMEFILQDMVDDTLSLPPEYVVQYLGYRAENSLPADLQQELRNIWLQAILRAAPLKAEKDLQLGALMQGVWDVLGQGTPIPHQDVGRISPDYAAALEQYHTENTWYREQVRRALAARGLIQD